MSLYVDFGLSLDGYREALTDLSDIMSDARADFDEQAGNGSDTDSMVPGGHVTDECNPRGIDGNGSDHG